MAQIITSLRERQKINEQIQYLLNETSEQEFKKRAHRIARSGDQVIPVILNNLKHPSSSLLSVLGVISSFYPDRDELGERLYEIAADTSLPDRNRAAAMAIMERFLDIDPDAELVGTLNDPSALVADSVAEIIDSTRQDPNLLIGYAREMARQSSQVLDRMVATLVQMGQEQAAPILGVLAQEQSEYAAQSAIKAMGQLRYPLTAQWLRSLIAMLPPDRRSLAERNLRKLQFSGVPLSDLLPVDASWRTLVSPLDGVGSQVVWFIHYNSDATRSDSTCWFLGLTLSGEQETVNAYGGSAVPVLLLPPHQPQGYFHVVSLPDHSMLNMLEANLDYGRRLVREWQQLTWARDHEMPPEYRMMGHRLWEYQEDASGPPPVEVENPLLWLDEMPQLLDHPAFKGWFVYDNQAVDYIFKAWSTFQSPHWKTWTTQLTQIYFDKQRTAVLQNRLLGMAEWLSWAKEPRLAHLAMAAAQTVTTLPAAAHPLLYRMTESGIQVIVDLIKKQMHL